MERSIVTVTSLNGTIQVFKEKGSSILSPVPIMETITTNSVMCRVNSWYFIGSASGNVGIIEKNNTPSNTYIIAYDILVLFVKEGIQAMPRAAMPIMAKQII
jgi:hypothetical protein